MSSTTDELEEKIAELEQEYETDHEIGEQNINPLGLDLHNPVFVISAGLILLFVVGSLLMPEAANNALGSTRSWIGLTFDWLFLSSANLFVLAALLLIVLPIGSIRIGGEDAKPSFGVLSWFSMLFAAGMGIGLMFWAVAEPVAYYTDWWGTPLGIEAGSEASRGASLGATMYHWGLHPWSIYAVVGLSLAFFTYNKGLPLTVRSAFYPLLGERIWGPIGHVIDVLAVLATMFGLATSLGLGAQQAAAGMSFMFGVDGGLTTQLAIIVGITIVALISISRGLHGGVRVLSNINLGMAMVFLLFVMLAGGFIAFLNTTGETLASYAQYMLPLSNPVGREDSVFYHDWTIFFWAWWISWSPFVGMFIARVSKGRTVRQFVTAVLLVPTGVTVLWMSALGGQGLNQVRDGVGGLADGLGASELALFQMLDALPLTSISATVAIILVLVFFVTSSDSGSLVIDSITSGGKTDSPQAQRLFWATFEGLIAAVLLAVGGAAALQALQAASVSAGLPFVIVLLFMTVSLYKGLYHERSLLKLNQAVADEAQSN
ncbi:betaine/carnitine transporter, BCCT family [Ectothiorhodosinus mongolicus]|uniref:Betaine/carnitine transporter, BCCT family n=1 Tax=Ectothiorhodosinus mongolicus TaxID=233100 RepID=A0A1R3VW13_9GAMM|nr:BCCT family transporter [Ectothiorhodosinus mongolicus]ULX56943.1 BCCT family transporter [Ectothiorhodosinus mongolicus]SIT69107.1 betaine/carnitine transporter, BCCT family [Ectothiorhodosinus mongolicus]